MNYDTILVFGAHPDDEITMAGTMAKLADAGCTVVVAIYTNGCEGYPRPEMKDEIVEMRRREMAECDKVVGISRRVCFDREDMALVNDKETVKDTVRLIREVRPDAVFTHGPDDVHRDHLNTYAITREAWWHAGQPVAAELGPSWRTPHLYYYKAMGATSARRDSLPTVVIDVTDTYWRAVAARGTQVSQHTLFGRTKEEFDAEAERLREHPEPRTETFWIAERVHLHDFLPRGL
ncbi:MAG: PIG-L deacetylase family protein [Armatimonadota bacterium]